MRAAAADRPDIDGLLSALCDAELSPSQMDCLNRLLRSDPAARRRYVGYLGLHATLQYTIGADLPRGLEGLADSPGTPGACRDLACGAAAHRPPLGRLRSIGAAAAAVLIAGLVVAAACWLRRPEAPAPRGPVRSSGGSRGGPARASTPPGSRPA